MPSTPADGGYIANPNAVALTRMDILESETLSVDTSMSNDLPKDCCWMVVRAQEERSKAKVEGLGGGDAQDAKGEKWYNVCRRWSSWECWDVV